MKDTDLMPWGKHKGTKMANVPSNYLLWLHYNEKCYGNVKAYIEDNMDALKQDSIMKESDASETDLY